MHSNQRQRPAWRAALLGAIAALAFAGGCTSPVRVVDPLTQGALGGNGAAEQTAYWYQLARRPVVSNDEAMHGLLLYFTDNDPNADYAGRVADLKGRGMLTAGFDRPGDEAAKRGTIAYAIAKGAGIKGGMTMQLLGSSPRYADRALQFRGLLPAGSPNQMMTGGQFAAVIGRLEDFQRGNANEKPAALLPGEIGAASPDLFDIRDAARPDDSPADIGRPLMLNVLAMSTNLWWQDSNATQPASQPTKANPAKLRAIITGVEGEQAEIRKTPTDAWARARVGQSLGEGAELRTGPKSAIRFVIPPDQVFTVDRQCSCTVQQAVFDGKKLTTKVEMERGRVRMDVAPIATPLPAPAPGEAAPTKYRFDQAGFEHDVSIRSPNAALAVRGTLVSLYDEPGFTPEAVSLSGRAAFENTRRQLVAFGGQTGRTMIRGDQSGAAEQSLLLATQPPNAEVARNDFDNQQTAMLLDRGGTQRGDVLVGNSKATDATLVRTLPGALNFVLRWEGGEEEKLNDLNLRVYSPLHTSEKPDFVGNPPFKLSLVPGDPAAEAERAKSYPRTSRSGGQISKNHIGPEGLEFASWTKKYPVGNYQVEVFNLLDAKPIPETAENQVSYTVDVFLNKRKIIETVSTTVGDLQTDRIGPIPIPAKNATATKAFSPDNSPRRTRSSR